MQADNSVAYQYVLCNAQCDTYGALDVSATMASNGCTQARIGNVSNVNGSRYNCHVATSLEHAHAAANEMVRDHPLSAAERVVLCKIKQRSAAASAPVASLQPVPSTGLVGMSTADQTTAYTYIVHRHAMSGDRIVLESPTDSGARVALVDLNGPYFVPTLQQARDIASRLGANVSKQAATIISRIESSALIGARAALESVPAAGMPADNAQHYAYLVLRCLVRLNGRLNVHTSGPDAAVQATVFPYRGECDYSRNMTFVRDRASVQKAVEDEQTRRPLVNAQRLLLCKIKCVSAMSSNVPTAAAPAVAALRTDNKSYRYMVHRHDAAANGALEMQSTSGDHWSRLRGNGMYMAETADEANRIVAQQCAAEPRAVNQVWLVSRVECVVQSPPQPLQCPSLVFVSV